MLRNGAHIWTTLRKDFKRSTIHYIPAGMASALFTILLALKFSTKLDMLKLLVVVRRLNVVKTFE